MEMSFTNIDKLKAKLDNKRSLTYGELKRLKEHDRILEVYNSNAIEGSSLTLSETKVILETGITVNKKPLKDHLAATDLNKAIDFVEELVNQNQLLTERMTKQIHSIVLAKQDYDVQDIGNYRSSNVRIDGSNHTPPDAFFLEEEMSKLISWSDEVKNHLHTVEYAALLHYKFVAIHPFIDGNGRTARLLMNFALTEAGYPPVTIKVEDRLDKSFPKCQTKNYSPAFWETFIIPESFFIIINYLFVFNLS